MTDLYAKIDTGGGAIIVAPRIEEPTQAKYAEMGYYLVTAGTPQEDRGEFYTGSSHYELDSTGQYPVIVPGIVWTKIPEPNYADLVEKAIRSTYSQSQVEAIILNGTDTEEHAAELAALQAYRAECKANAKAYIQRWREA